MSKSKKITVYRKCSWCGDEMEPEEWEVVSDDYEKMFGDTSFGICQSCSEKVFTNAVKYQEMKNKVANDMPEIQTLKNKSNKLEKERFEGRAAFDDGKMIVGNPYPEMSREYFSWLDGYIMADLTVNTSGA